ncbi:hypothetical protein [Pseudomonas viridiflava]|uniref:hypothetical protein n=1 Tax=Pseudomonas viridiflava TaxID=33069 RepID=UPI000F0310B0|nr:hypothetical protein [Pseudomonas viridiflava]QXG27180.1 hypothetical protein KTT56_10165 [Pseudomonas viridiflava]
MKDRILDAIAQSQQDGRTVLEIHLWSKEAVEEIHRSPEFNAGAFIGIPVKYLGRENKIPEHDFLLITKG